MYDVVADVFAYPSWWSQVRTVVPIDERTARLVIRSVLPYALHCQAESVVEDRAGGRLEVRLSGDVVGSARWTLRQEDMGPEDMGPENVHTVLHYEQDVDTPHWPLRAVRDVKWVPAMNHAWMMRRGETGLRRKFAAMIG